MPFVLSALGVLLWLVTGCPGDSAESDDGRACTPGQQIECFCSDGRRGAQRCYLDGTGFSPCVCAGDQDTGRPDQRGEDSGRPDRAVSDGATDDRDEGPADAEPDDAEPDARRPDTPEPDTEPDAEPDAEPDTEPDTEPDGPERLAALGEDCDRASACETDICLGLMVGGELESVCAQPCCHENECPLQFGCLQAGASRYCLPSRIFPPSFTFEQPTGGACRANPNACKSGICDSSADLCRGTCCTDADCGVAPCHWSVTGSTLRTFCDPLALLNGDGRTGMPCSSEFDCRAGICAQSGDPPSFRCADLCCSPLDCPGTTCGLVSGLGGAVVRACVDAPTGPNADGTPCSDDGESCAGGQCVEGACRTVCCDDTNCTAPMRCLPRTMEGVLVPVCTHPDE